LAFGEVIGRQGDFHGPTVNLAARLVAAAEPGVVLTDVAMATRLGRIDDRLSFHPAGRYTLAGYAEPVEAFQLLRVRSCSPRQSSRRSVAICQERTRTEPSNCSSGRPARSTSQPLAGAPRYSTLTSPSSAAVRNTRSSRPPC